MKEMTAKQKANERYRQKNKEYYANYYREYRKTHKVKDYYGEWKKKVNTAREFLQKNSNNFKKTISVEKIEELYNLLGSDTDEK